MVSLTYVSVKVLRDTNAIPECGMIGAPPITSTTFQDYIIPFWFREAIFRQDASLGFLSDKKRSTENTGYTYVLLCFEILKCRIVAYKYLDRYIF